jgi:hypothetical protein
VPGPTIGRSVRAAVNQLRCSVQTVAAMVCGVVLLAGVTAAPAAAAAKASGPATHVTIATDQLQTSPFMGLGVEFDPYDTLSPATINWPLIEQRLDFMAPGFLRVVLHVSNYFTGFNASHVPVYNWTNPQVEELLSILGYAKAQGIPVVLGNWEDPVLDGNAAVAADFVLALRNTYGFTNIDYYNVENEPNNSTTCGFSCWEGIMKQVATAFDAAGLQHTVQLVGPDNENSWDDDPPAAARDLKDGLDADNPLDGDSWLTDTLKTIPTLIGAYDTHRYATIAGVENGVYGDQVRSRRLEISHLSSASKPWFDGEAGLTARQVSPFGPDDDIDKVTPALRAELDPSDAMADVSSFVDDQPNITSFQYGTWMGDMMIQAINAGLSGASAWDLDDAMHNGGGYGNFDLKQWGFFNSLGGQNGYPASDINLRPWYFAWATLSRAFPGGAQPLVVPGPGVAGLRVAAARIRDDSAYGSGYDLSLAVVDDSTAPRTITLSVPSVTGALAMSQYDYYPTGLAVDGNGLPVATPVQERPAGGITLQVPADGMVVLTSRGDNDPTPLDEGAGFLDDQYTSWKDTAYHSKLLGFARASASEFNDSPTRVGPTGKRPGELIYRTDQLSSLELEAYSAKTPSLSAYGSENGATWWPIALTSTQPAPALGGHELLYDLLAGGLPAGTNQLKLVIGKGTELAETRLATDRSGPACVPAAGGETAESILGVAPGASGSTVTRAIGVPSTTTNRVRHYCVSGGGALSVVFNRAGVELVGTTARGYRLGGIPEGLTQTALGRAYRKAPLRAAGGGVFVSAAGIVYVVRARRVAAEAVVPLTLARSNRSVASALRLAALS